MSDRAGVSRLRVRAAYWAMRTTVFWAGFVIAASVLALVTFFAVSGIGPIAPASPVMLAALIGNFAIIFGLAWLVLFRVSRVARPRGPAQPGQRLHLRFAWLFSFAAVVPAAVVAVFLGLTLSRGVDSWFSGVQSALVENSVDLARTYVTEATNNMRGDVFAMAGDLNQAADGLSSDPGRYAAYLGRQASGRSFAAAYVLARNGDVLAQAEGPRAPGFTPPSLEAFQDAEQGVMSMKIVDEQNLIRALFKLDAYPNAFLYVVRFAEPGVLERLRDTERQVLAYREAKDRRDRLQLQFLIAYLQTVILILLGSVSLGLSYATRIARPIGQLADAAERVTTGDLTTRVEPGPKDDEIAGLARAFNRMSEQLDAQRQDLLDAREDAESRRRFIETVLSGVSAGVIGVDGRGRIAVANASAAALLGVAPSDITGASLGVLAPELAALAKRGPDASGAARIEQVDITRDGEVLSLQVRAAGAPDGSGVILTFDDVTRLVAAQRQAAWKDVARRIAHEIKNPLTPIQLSAERLHRKYLSEIASDRETFERCTDTIIRQVHDIGRMVDEFSAFARMPEARFEDADMVEMVRTTVFAQRLANPDCDIEWSEPEAPMVIACDHRLAGQALTNVIKNASESISMRRARDGEPKTGRIVVQLEKVGDAAVISVQDNGLGFPAKGRARLVEPYMTTREKGAGLGLAIVKRVMEDHGGQLILDDAPAPGPGAVVRLVFPAGAGASGGLSLERKEIA